jgi:hypothetical protein
LDLLCSAISTKEQLDKNDLLGNEGLKSLRNEGLCHPTRKTIKADKMLGKDEENPE